MRNALLILLAACIFLLSACTAEPKNNTFYTISTNEDLTYSYKIFDQKGNVLFSGDHSTKEPHIEKVTDWVYSVTVQAGTGCATNWAVFCDVKEGTVSETFHYVLGAQGEYVFFVEVEDSSHSVVVQNIFDGSRYRKVYSLQNTGALADPACEITFDSEGKATVTYLTDTETAVSRASTTIYFPELYSPADATLMPEDYDQILQNLINAYPWNDNELDIVPENPELSYLYRYQTDLSQVGYALVDLDQNGQAELLLGDMTYSQVFDVYTIKDGQIVHLLDSGERYSYQPLENGYFELAWSSSSATSGHDYFQLLDGELVLLERLVMDGWHALDIGLIKDISEATEDNTCFRSKTNLPADYTLITFDELMAGISAWQAQYKPLTITYTPLSKYGK